MNRVNRAKAIRLKCLDCCNQQQKEVKECPVKDCTLWRYRMGTEVRDDLYYKSLETNEKKRKEREASNGNQKK